MRKNKLYFPLSEIAQLKRGKKCDNIEIIWRDVTIF